MKERPSTLIEKAISKHDWTMARKIVRQELKQDPTDHWLLSRLALTHYEQRQYRRAYRFYVEALQTAPYCPLAVDGYAATLDMLGNNKEALKLYRWLLTWGEDTLAYGECGEGIRAARSLIADCHYRIGLICEKLGQRKKALASYAEHLAMRQRGARSIHPLREVKSRHKQLINQTSNKSTSDRK